MKVSVLDLGSNTVKMVNYIVDDADYNRFYAFNQKSMYTRLGEDLTSTGFLSKKSIKRTVEALQAFRDEISSQSIKRVIPIATSAVREAVNQNEFLEIIKKETGFNFIPISETDEALYSYLGAMHSLRVPNVLFFDMGGGSVEIVYAQNFEIKKIMSLPLGALRLTNIYADSKTGIINKKEYEKIKSRVLELIPKRDEITNLSHTRLVGVGGNLRAIAKHNQYVTNYPVNKLHNYTMSQKQFASINSKLISNAPRKISKLDGISTGRAETIAAGACVIYEIMESIGFDSITVSTHGLREGILVSHLLLSAKTGQNKTNTARQVENLLQKRFANGSFDYYKGVTQFENVKQLADSLTRLGEFDSSERKLLENVTEVLYANHELDADAMFEISLGQENHLDHHEQLIASLAMIHSIKKKKAEKLMKKFDSMIKRKDKDQIVRLSSIVACFVLLQHRTVTSASVDKRDKKLTISLYESPYTNNGKKQAQAGKNTTAEKECKKMLEDTFGITVSFEYGKPYDGSYKAKDSVITI